MAFDASSTSCPSISSAVTSRPTDIVLVLDNENPRASKILLITGPGVGYVNDFPRIA